MNKVDIQRLSKPGRVVLMAASVPVEKGDHALPPLEVGTQRGEYHRVRRWVRLQASGHLQQHRHTHRRLGPRCLRRYHRRRVVIRMDEHRLIPRGPRILPRHHRPHVVRHPLLPIHPPPQPHLHLSIYQPPPQPLSSGSLHPKARHIQRYRRVLALRLLRSRRIRSHKHHRPRPQRRGLQPSIPTGKIHHHHPPSHLLPIEIAPNPHHRPKLPTPATPAGGTVEVRAPFGHTAHKATDSSSHSNRPPRSTGTTTAKESRRVAQPQRLQPLLHILRRLDTPRIPRHPATPARPNAPPQPRGPVEAATGPMAKANQKGDNQRNHNVPISAPSIPSSKQTDGRGFFRHWLEDRP